MMAATRNITIRIDADNVIIGFPSRRARRTVKALNRYCEAAGIPKLKTTFSVHEIGQVILRNDIIADHCQQFPNILSTLEELNLALPCAYEAYQQGARGEQYFSMTGQILYG